MSTEELQPKHNGGLDPMKTPDAATAASKAEELIREGMTPTDDYFSSMVTLAVYYAAHAVKTHEDRETKDACIDDLLSFFSDHNYQADVLRVYKDQASGAWFIRAPLDTQVQRFFEHAYYGAWNEDTRRQIAISATNALIQATREDRPQHSIRSTLLPVEQQTSGYCLPCDEDPMNDNTHPLSAADSTARFVLGTGYIRDEYFQRTLTLIIRNAAAAVKSYEDCYRAERARTHLLELFFANPTYRAIVLDTIAGRGEVTLRPLHEQLTSHSPKLDETTTRFFNENFYGSYTPNLQLYYLWYCKNAVASAMYEFKHPASSRTPSRETMDAGE